MLSLTIETWVDSLAWERATSPAAPDRRIGRTDGLDRASPGYFAKKPSKFDEINPRSGFPLSSPPLSSSHSPLRWRTRPAVLRGPREMRQRAGGTAGCRRAAGWPGAAAVRMPRLGAAPRPLSFPTSGGQARRRPSATGVAPRAKAGRGGGAAPSGPSPTSRTGHGGCQA